jgi:hypothetical protein
VNGITLVAGLRRIRWLWQQRDGIRLGSRDVIASNVAKVMLVLHLPAGLASWLHKTPSLPSHTTPMSPISLFPRPFFSCAFFWLPTYAATPDTCLHKLSRCHVWYFILSLYLTRFLAWSQPIYPSINVSGIQGLQRVFGELAFW